MQTIRTGFAPEQHGFKFPNDFEFSDFLHIQLPFGPFPALPVGQIVCGLWGGMRFAALDYYDAQKPIRPFVEANDISLRLFFYLWARQLASLDHGVVQNVFRLTQSTQEPL
jgi:hypothetical protein